MAPERHNRVAKDIKLNGCSGSTFHLATSLERIRSFQLARLPNKEEDVLPSRTVKEEELQPFMRDMLLKSMETYDIIYLEKTSMEEIINLYGSIKTRGIKIYTNDMVLLETPSNSPGLGRVHQIFSHSNGDTLCFWVTLRVYDLEGRDEHNGFWRFNPLKTYIIHPLDTIRCIAHVCPDLDVFYQLGYRQRLQYLDWEENSSAVYLLES